MNYPTKIVHVNLSKSFRGGEFQTFELIKALHKHGVEQEVVCRTNSLLAGRLAELPFAQITQVSGPLNGHFWRRSEKQNTVVHAHEARGVYWAWIEKLIRRTPYLVTRRVINPIGNSWITQKAYHNADALVAVSKFSANVLSQRVNRHVSVVMDACRQMFPHNHRHDSFDALKGCPRIGHIGEFDDAVKGQGLLIQAFLQLLKVYPRACLYLVGEGKDRARFIVFVGSVDNVHDWLGQWDVFCFPSKMEALGSSVLEAMAVGVPVIVSVEGGLPELAGNQERGLIVSHATPEAWSKAITDVLTQTEKTNERKAQAQAFSLGNNPANMGEKYLEIYRDVLR